MCFFSGETETETETNIYAQVLQKAAPCPCCPWTKVIGYAP